MLLAIVDVVLRVLAQRFGTMRWTLERTSPSVSSALSAARALRTAREAARRVPAYGDHLERHGIDPAHIRSLDELPETDKASYIDPNPLPSRCLDGRLPLIGSTIDESSGSTGTPYNWVRGAAERDHVRRMISFFARYSFGDEPLVVLNAFSMGAWATGMTTAIALERNGLVKATGPHVDKILGTMRELGTGHRYLIVGYPPFLKLLLDEGDARGFDWSAYTMHALLGGEGNSEGLRDYLLRRFRSVVSGYGATDVEIGLAAETPVTVALRRLALERTGDRGGPLRRDRSRPDGLPVQPDAPPRRDERSRRAALHGLPLGDPVAQGPLQRPRRGRRPARRRAAAAPRRLRDHAGVAGAGRLRPPRAHAIPLRLRPADSTVSVMGANIYPVDVEGGIYADPSLAAHVRSFRLSLLEERPGETRPLVSIELERGEPTEALTSAARARRSRRISWRRTPTTARRSGEYPELMVPVVRLFAAGTGPFAGSRRADQAPIPRLNRRDSLPVG